MKHVEGGWKGSGRSREWTDDWSIRKNGFAEILNAQDADRWNPRSADWAETSNPGFHQQADTEQGAVGGVGTCGEVVLAGCVRRARLAATQVTRCHLRGHTKHCPSIHCYSQQNWITKEPSSKHEGLL